MKQNKLEILGTEFYYDVEKQELHKTKNGKTKIVKGFLHQKKLHVKIFYCDEVSRNVKIPLDKIIFALILNKGIEDMKNVTIKYLDENPKNLNLNNIYIKTIESDDGTSWLSRKKLIDELLKTHDTKRRTLNSELIKITDKLKTSAGYNRLTMYGKTYKTVNRTGESYV